MSRVRSLGFALIMLLSAAAASTASAQQLKPLDVAKDANGVDLLSGQINTRLPVLGVPGSGQLQMKSVQDFQPLLIGNLYASVDNQAKYDINNGGSTSDHFDCTDNGCTASKKRNGSSLIQDIAGGNFVYTQGGTATRYYFNQRLYNQDPIVGNMGFSFYPSAVAYANGETHSFTYDVYTNPSSGYVSMRPAVIASSLGYSITLTYAEALEQPLGTVVTKATMRGPDSSIVAELTYSGSSITDLAGRTYTCTNCGNGLGAASETTTTSLRLPGESVDTLVATGSSCSSGGYSVISSVTADGVAYAYNFTRLGTGVTCKYLTKTVITAPLGFSRVVNIQTSTQAGYRPRITSIVDSLNRTTSYEYDSEVRVIKTTFPEGNSASVVYDGLGNITESRMKAKTGSGLTDLVETASYPLSSNCTAVPEFCTSPDYWRPAWTKDAKGQQTDYTWSSTHGGMLTKLEPADASGVRRKTINEYTGSRLTRERICAANAAGVEQTCGTASEIVREFTYWGATFLPATETVKDGTGGQARTTSFAYDSAGRLLSSDGPTAGTDDATYNRYDTAGRKTWEIGPKGANGYRAATRTTYRDADDQPLTIEKGTIVNATDTVLTVINTQYLTYDTRRKVIKQRTAAGGSDLAVSQMSYDARNRDSCTAVRMNPAVWASLPADACTLGTAGTAGADRITRTNYDVEDRIILIEKAVGTPLEQDYVAYTYTVNGKREFTTDANGNKAKFQYDGHDRQTHWWFPSKTTVGTVSTTDYEQYGYDANGNRLTVRRRDGRTLTFAYDARNQLTSKVVPDGCAPIQVGACTPATATRDVYYTYDVQGRQLTAKFDSSAGADGLTSVYDVFGRLTSSTISMGGFSKALTALYDDSDNRTRVTHPDGNYFTYAYDPADQMTGALENGSTSLVSFAYTPIGERDVTTLAGASTDYGYDGISRLTSLSHNLASSSRDAAWTFGYNVASQTASTTRDNDAYAWGGHANVDRPYAVNGLNQYTTAGTATFTHDANGNLTADGTTTYVYDAENRLVSHTTGGVTATLTWDPMGRLWQVVKGTANTRFLYDGDELVAEYGSTGTVLRRYVHGAGVDDPMIWYEGASLASSGRRQLFADRQGSIIGIADSAGTSIGVNAYDEYGIPKSSDPLQPVIGRFAYTGQAWLPEIGLYHYKARFYSPTLGRFLQTDPIGYEDDVNLYAYVSNDPQNYADETGHGKLAFFMRVLRGGRSYWKEVTQKKAFREISRRKTDFRVEGGGSSKKAKQLQRTVSGSRTKRHDGHELENGQTGRPHYQDKSGGPPHTFYSAAAALTATSYLTESSTTAQRTTAEVIDFFNPFSDIKTAMELSDEAFGTELTKSNTDTGDASGQKSRQSGFEIGEDYIVGNRCTGRLDCPN